MPISIGTDPTKAFTDLGRLEREIRSMIRRNGGDLRPSASSVSKGKRNSVRYTGALREKVASVVEITTTDIARAIGFYSPKWSSWLRSNFEHAQGAKPPLSTLLSPAVKKRGQYASQVEPIINGVKLDGTKPQYIYNTVDYAAAVARGDFPGISASLDWYLDIEQRHAGGRYVRDAVVSVAGGKK